jgi:hypothetical protein
MARASKKGVAHSPVRTPTRFETYNDPTVLTAHAQSAADAFSDMLKRSRAQGGHDVDAVQNDRPIFPINQDNNS